MTLDKKSINNKRMNWVNIFLQELIEYPECSDKGYNFIYNGYECIIKRDLLGTLNGYVKILYDHQFIEFMKNNEIEYQYLFDVYGTLDRTYKDETGIMIGFDCGHLSDIVPVWEIFHENSKTELEAAEKFHKAIIFLQNIDKDNKLFYTKKDFRSIEFVRNELCCLVDQIESFDYNV
jgi:hypothetical protein